MKTDTLRAPILWFGGKGKMVAKLQRHVPDGGKPYCEPYMGAASLFFARPPAPVEVLNDLDGNLVNLFRCLQDKTTFEELKHRLLHTLYSRAEFARALDILTSEEPDQVLRAWAFFVALNQGFGGVAKSVGRWGRAFVSDGGCAGTTNRWIMRLSMLEDWHKRLLMVQIDNRDALDVIKYWDNPDAVFYVDPPYHPDTRKTKSIYADEPDEKHHQQLVQTLLGCQGAVVLSCYDHPVYQPLETAGWQKTEYNTACYAAGRVRGSSLRGNGNVLAKAPRVEVVFCNPKAAKLKTTA